MTDIQTEEDLMSEVFSKVPSAIIILDFHGVVRKANAVALSMLGESQLEGCKWYEIVKAVFRPRKDDGTLVSTRDGKRLQVSTVPLAHGQLVQMTDQTQTRQLQDKIAHMERLSSLGRMAASLAHQIRTPLSAAILYAANLGNPKLPPISRRTFQKKLMSRLEALESQVSDILMYARSGEQTVAKVDAVDLVEHVVQNTVSVLTRGNAELITEIGDRPMPILGNLTALNGAVGNLVSNAVEAGAKKIKLRLEASENEVALYVGNDGPEIPKEQRRIFF